MADGLLQCVQCAADYRQSDNEGRSCRYHSGHKVEFGSTVWYSCCPSQRTSRDLLPYVPGCTRGRHAAQHHSSYSYSSYEDFMCQQSRNAREIWLEFSVEDLSYPGNYEWIEVGLSASNKVYILIGDQSRCISFKELDIAELREETASTVILEKSHPSGWRVKAEISLANERLCALEMSIKPSFRNVAEVKRVIVNTEGRVPRLLRVESVGGQQCPPELQMPYSPPADSQEGPELLGLGCDFSKGRRNDYDRETENGCPLKLLQVGHTTVFSRQCRTENDKWENIFMATVQIINTAEEKLDVSAVLGEYLNEGEWVECDDVEITKDFFPGMYKWSLARSGPHSRRLSLSSGFTDTLSVQFAIRFPGKLPDAGQREFAHHSLPQPMHLRVTFTCQEGRSASLQFEQGNPARTPSHKLRERQINHKLLFYKYADDVHTCTRSDAAIYYNKNSGELCYQCAPCGSLKAPHSLWPLLRYAALQATLFHKSEWELGDLRVELGSHTIQIFAMTDLGVPTPRAVKVFIKTATSSSTGYYLLPSTDHSRATFSVWPKQVFPSSEITVEWNVPWATTTDHIAICKVHGRESLAEVSNVSGSNTGSIKLKVPDCSGLHEIRYYSMWLQALKPARHKQYWLAASIFIDS